MSDNNNIFLSRWSIFPWKTWILCWFLLAVVAILVIPREVERSHGIILLIPVLAAVQVISWTICRLTHFQIPVEKNLAVVTEWINKEGSVGKRIVSFTGLYRYRRFDERVARVVNMGSLTSFFRPDIHFAGKILSANVAVGYRISEVKHALACEMRAGISWTIKDDLERCLADYTDQAVKILSNKLPADGEQPDDKQPQLFKKVLENAFFESLSRKKGDLGITCEFVQVGTIGLMLVT